MLYGLGGKAGYHPSAQKPEEDTGRDLAAGVLSFGGIIFGSFTGVRLLDPSQYTWAKYNNRQWAPVAADYNVRLPVETSSWKVFWLTFVGLYIPIVSDPFSSPFR
jgi:hypothetical protein